ncbi:hypothetical protein V1509DRAFT_638423 [Lipomyces kononenkoae]
MACLSTSTGSFWPDVGSFLSAINALPDTGLLSHTQCQAKVRLFPKTGSKDDIRNWRPISLQNTDCRIISKALNTRPFLSGEAYGKLRDDKDMWVNGMGVNVFILLCFKERPRFANPATVPYQDVTDWRAEVAAMSRTIGEANALNNSQDYYGPLIYRGYAWTGELHDAFIEVGDRIRMRDFGFHVGVDALPATLGLKISDLYPRDVWEAVAVEDSIIPFDSPGFLNGLAEDTVAAAQIRFEGFLYEKLGF